MFFILLHTFGWILEFVLKNPYNHVNYKADYRDAFASKNGKMSATNEIAGTVYY